MTGGTGIGASLSKKLFTTEDAEGTEKVLESKGFFLRDLRVLCGAT